MNRKDLTTLALRLIGVYGLVVALQYVVFAALVKFGARGLPDSAQDLEPYTLSSAVAWGIAALVLLPGASRIASWWSPSSESTPASSALSADARAIRPVALQLLGAYVLTYTLPGLASRVPALLDRLGRGEFDAAFWRSMELALLFHDLIGAAIGMYLLFGARGLGELVERARGVGLQSEEKAWRTPRA